MLTQCDYRISQLIKKEKILIIKYENKTNKQLIYNKKNHTSKDLTALDVLKNQTEKC